MHKNFQSIFVNVVAKLEVSDTKGEVKYLQEHLEDYATSLLKGREILILLEIKSKYIQYFLP